jgi:hypothetical protein
MGRTGTLCKSFRQRLAHRKFLKTTTGHRRLEMREGKHFPRALSAKVSSEKTGDIVSGPALLS